MTVLGKPNPTGQGAVVLQGILGMGCLVFMNFFILWSFASWKESVQWWEWNGSSGCPLEKLGEETSPTERYGKEDKQKTPHF